MYHPADLTPSLALALPACDPFVLRCALRRQYDSSCKSLLSFFLVLLSLLPLPSLLSLLPPRSRSRPRPRSCPRSCACACTRTRPPLLRFVLMGLDFGEFMGLSVLFVYSLIPPPRLRASLRLPRPRVLPLPPPSRHPSRLPRLHFVSSWDSTLVSSWD